MSVAYRHWLPPAALIDDRVREGCAEVVAAWSARWSPSGATLRLRDLRVRRPLPSATETRRIGTEVEIAWSEPLGLRLAGWALGLDSVPSALTTADRAVLASLAEDIALDLTTSLALHFSIKSTAPGANPSVPYAEHVAFKLDLPGHATGLTVSIPADRIVQYRKARCATRRQAPALTTFDAATLLPEHPIELEATLGSSQISLRDLRTIEIGDVIRLDTRLESPLPITRCGSRAAICGGIFQPGEAGALLTLQRNDAVISP